MTEAPPAAPAFRTSRMLVAALAGLLGHGLAVGAGYLAARVITPSNGGFEDLAGAVTTFLGVELLVAIACVVVGIVRLRRPAQRDEGAGLLGGWLIGLVAVIALIGS